MPPFLLQTTLDSEIARSPLSLETGEEIIPLDPNLNLLLPLSLQKSDSLAALVEENRWTKEKLDGMRGRSRERGFKADSRIRARINLLVAALISTLKLTSNGDLLKSVVSAINAAVHDADK